MMIKAVDHLKMTKIYASVVILYTTLTLIMNLTVR